MLRSVAHSAKALHYDLKNFGQNLIKKLFFLEKIEKIPVIKIHIYKQSGKGRTNLVGELRETLI